MTLEPNASWSARIDLTLLVDEREVAEQTERVARLTPRTGTQLCKSPLPDYCLVD